MKIHDRAIFKAFAAEGLPVLSKFKNNEELGFKDINVSNKKLLARIENICLHFRANVTKFKNYLRRNPSKANVGLDGIMGKTRIDPNKIFSSIHLEYEEDGSIKYPINVSGTLRILNLGVIEWERQNFHSARNLLPIGYKAIRTYASVFYKDKKCDYTCEILDNGNAPLYKVTSHEDPENPIIHDASSGAWIEICKKINDLNCQGRGKVTVSGPDRFGVAEPSVT